MPTNIKLLPNKRNEIFHFLFCPNCLYFLEQRNEIKAKKCPMCSGDIEKAKYLIPEYGFEVKDLNLFRVSQDGLRNYVYPDFPQLEKTKRKIPITKEIPYKPAPSGRVVSFLSSKGTAGADEPRTIGKFTITPYLRSQITVINLKSQVNIKSGLPIKLDRAGRRFRANLGYQFYTDILVINPPFWGEKKPNEAYLSLLYALLEGASQALDINREDIDGILYPSEDTELVIYDNVPAGAGFIREIYENFENILAKAEEIVSNCSCSEDSCCPSCILHYSNQYFADILQRQAALELIRIGKG